MDFVSLLNVHTAIRGCLSRLSPRRRFLLSSIQDIQNCPLPHMIKSTTSYASQATACPLRVEVQIPCGTLRSVRRRMMASAAEPRYAYKNKILAALTKAEIARLAVHLSP